MSNFFTKRYRIKEILNGSVKEKISISGWISSFRKQKTVTFINMIDGSNLNGIQIIAPPEMAEKLSNGCSISVKGFMQESLGKEQKYELVADSVDIIGTSPENSGFVQIHNPIITTLDCEGGGETFQLNDDPKDPFFQSSSFLTVSGQLHAEFLAAGMSRVYTFGPTFRAEKHQTSRHLAEFIMLEPEICFIEHLGELTKIVEESLKSALLHVSKESNDDLEYFFSQGISDRNLFEALISKPFATVTYAEAIKLLQSCSTAAGFKFPVSYENGLQSEHEKYLAEKIFSGAVFVTNYPSEQKPFYMKIDDINCSDSTVSCVDLLVPRVGEIVGGSLREDRYSVLKNAMMKKGLINDHKYKWYLDLRKYGSVPHGGYGIGFERLIQLITGLPNIKDTIPVPRTRGSIWQ